MTTPRTNASYDQNNVTTLMGVSTTDGTTPVPVEVNPTTGALLTATSNGTNTADVVSGDTGNNGVVTVGARKEVSFTTTSAQAVATTDVSNYRWVSVHAVTQGTSSTIDFQGSNDNTNWVAVALMQPLSTASAPQTSTGTANTLFAGPVNYRYFRLNVTGISAGTTAGVVEFFANAAGLQSLGVNATQNGTWSVGASSATGSTVPANAFYVAGSNAGTLQGAIVGSQGDGQPSTGMLQIGQVLFNGTNYDRTRAVINGTNSTGTGIISTGMVAQLDDTSPTVITENQFGNLRMDTARQLRVNAQSIPDATLLNTYSIHLTTNTTTTPTSATAYISSISISNEVGGTTSTVTIQDKQGTPLKLINGFSTTSLTTTPTVVNFQTPVKMVSGIDIITAGAVAATVDVWVNYYQ